MICLYSTPVIRVQKTGLKRAALNFEVNLKFWVALFIWDRLFLNSVNELEKKDYGVYTSIKELNCVIYKKEI